MKRKDWPLITFPIVLFLLFTLPSLVLSVNGKSNRATLQGLKGIGVLVENLPQEVEKEGITKNQLQIEVELKLREARIPILSREECLKTPGEPYLYININVNTAKTESDIYPYSLDVMLIQKVSLMRDPKQTTYSVTWSTGGVGSVSKQSIHPLRNSVGDIVDVFIQAYLAENPPR
jgi:hypothetical protein